MANVQEKIKKGRVASPKGLTSLDSGKITIFALMFFSLFPTLDIQAETNVFVGTSYTFSVPDGVQAEEDQRYKDSYTFRFSDHPALGLFTLNSDPVSTNPKVLPHMASIGEINIEDQLDRLNYVENLSKNRIEVQWGFFKGIISEITILHGAKKANKQYLFFLYDGKQVWTGHLIAHSPDNIQRVENILKSAQKN